MRKLLLISVLLSAMVSSCSKDEIEFQNNDLKIKIIAGDNWLHDFPLFLGINKKNPPQFAVWLTDLDTNYVGTIFCTHKIAREGWIANKGNRRKEALPFWCHNRGVVYSDGLYLPTKSNPLVDGLTGATPTGDYFVKVSPTQNSTYLIFAEFNHSVDFNSYYKENSPQGSFYYSGGSEGSGQPALVYCARIDLNSAQDYRELQLIGHSSPDGSNGNLYANLNEITSAKNIISKVIVERK